MSDQPLKVVYIAGFGRSGTSILASVLGQAPGMVSVGEICRMWEFALVSPNACGCRDLVPDCLFWNEVFDDAFGGINVLDSKQTNRMLRRYARTRHYVIRGDPTPSRPEPDELHHLRNTLGQLYQSIAQVSGSRVIVDNSKRPMYARLLDHVPGLELHVIHLVRDPRAVAHSWARNKVQPVTGLPAMRMGLLKSSLLWSGLNLVTEQVFGNSTDIKRYRLLKYEDFTARPRSVYRELLDFLEEPLISDPFVSNNGANIAFSHTMAGNSSRFERGLIEVAEDKEWETKMKAWRKTLIALLTWPVLKRYSYPLLNPRIP